MYEEDRPVQSGSYARGVEMAGYSSRALTWGLAVLVMVLLVSAFIWMNYYGFGEQSATEAVIEDGNYTPVAP